MIHKSILFFLVVAIFSLSYGFYSDKTDKSPLERYSTVKVYATSEGDILKLIQNDITVENYSGKFTDGLTLLINQEELARLKNTGLRYEVTIPDMDEFYKNRLPSTPQEMLKSSEIMRSDNITGFGYGSMGGYYTYAEVVQKLDSMRLQYPNLITAKQDRGTTYENRKVWSVKISDNPDIDESATEPAIYFDGLHHAREPQSMACLMYYMYWLLENYGTNPEATYLVNNREIYFIPVVNPDGYSYNQQTNPNGGGSWRKNRSLNSGSYGVDLNRNYSYKWGYDNVGSSGTPSSDTYRGPSPASEQETQGVQNLVNMIQPAIAFSMHSEASSCLNPWGYVDTAISYNIYSEFSSDFAAYSQYLYGTVSQMLAYTSNGTTRDYLHSIGTYCWVIEVGGGSFWPAIGNIIPVCNENMRGLKYLTWVGGAFITPQSYKITGKGYAEKNDTLKLEVELKNKGLKKTANNVTVEVTTSYPNVVPLVSLVNYDSVLSRQRKSNTLNPFMFRLTQAANYMDEIPLIISYKQEGVESFKDTLRITVGKATVLFSDDAEAGTSRWDKSGTQLMWDTTFCDSKSGNYSFADSRYGNSRNSTTNYFTLRDTIDLTGTANPRLEFWAKWAQEIGYDYTRIQISTNYGSTWTNLSGRYSGTLGGQPSYVNLKYWVNESINLTPYIGQRIRLRFTLYTDSGTPGDGFYFDDFKVINYTNTVTSVSENGNSIPDKYNLSQNYPNPFNPVTTINYSLPSDGFVSLKVYDITGKQVAELVNGIKKAGNYQAVFDGSFLSSGVYFYSIKINGFSDTKSFVLMK